MKEVKLLVTVQVDEADEKATIPDDGKQKAACQAVENAVRFAENNGFVHGLADDLCIGVVDVEAMETAPNHSQILEILVRELFSHIDRAGQPHQRQTRPGGTAEYDVLIPIPAELLRRLRAAVEVQL